MSSAYKHFFLKSQAKTAHKYPLWSASDLNNQDHHRAYLACFCIRNSSSNTCSVFTHLMSPNKILAQHNKNSNTFK